MPDRVDLECFDVQFAVEAIGSSSRAIRTMLDRLRNTPNLVTAYAKFTNVPPHIAEISFSKGCRQMYDPSIRALVITVPGTPHGAVIGEFYSRFAITTHIANIADTVSSLAGTRVQGTTCSKEPHGSWAPEDMPPGRNENWPTVVLEVGVSELRNKLRADAAWWLADSDGQVHVVIIISVNQTIAEVTFEKVTLQERPRYMRNGRRQFQPETRQLIRVSRTPGGPGQPITTVPNTSPLIITVQELLCRPPNTGETDPVIPISALERIACAAWRWQGL